MCSGLDQFVSDVTCFGASIVSRDCQTVVGPTSCGASVSCTRNEHLFTCFTHVSELQFGAGACGLGGGFGSSNPVIRHVAFQPLSLRFSCKLYFVMLTYSCL